MLRIHHEDTKARIGDESLESLAGLVVDAAFRVYSTLGPGLVERVYEACLLHEFKLRGVQFESQVSLPVTYFDIKLDAGIRLDVLVDRRIILELKTVEALLPVHKAQLLTYLKLTGHRLGFLINFNVSTFKEGIRRLVL